ncbi:MAG: metal-dependent hydrolase [Dehalococcoidales bacterium]|nr:metal-dependent hydrolase [Dehalococcoidales bacterium]
MAKPTGQYRVKVTWLWRAAFRFVSPEGKIIFIDPWLRDNPMCPAEYKDPGKLAADVILFTHSHYDHEGDTAELAKKSGARVVAIVDLMESLKQKGVAPEQVAALSYGGTAAVAGITASMVPAWHTTPPSVGFVIGFSSGLKIYHTGDTCLFSDMNLIKSLHAPQLALIPVGGTYTMDDYAASLACRDYLKPQYVIPMHYPANPRDTSPSDCAEKFRHHLQGSGIEVVMARPGETIEF